MNERTMRRDLRRRWRVSLLLGVFPLLLAWAGADVAQAAPGCTPEADQCPSFLGQIGNFGPAAGQLNNPRAAADPVTGHVFVLESGNRRVSEFDAEDNWSFVKAWGWGVRDGSPKLQTCTIETSCKTGLAGTGPGQIQFAFGITLDEEGNIWTLEPFSARVQKFSPGGEFLLMVGGDVNKTKVAKREEQEANAEPLTVTEAEENLCTAASGDLCGEGISGPGAGQFNFPLSIDASELGTSGIIYVGDENRILEFAEDGSYEGDIPLPGAGLTEALAVAPDGSLYVVSAAVEEGTTPAVREISPAGEEIRRLKGQWQGRTVPKSPRALAVDAEENVYVAATVTYEFPPSKEGESPILKDFEEVIAFEPDGDLISFEPDKAGFDRPVDDSDLVGVATNVVKDTDEPGEVLVAHYFNGSLSGKPFLSYVRVYGHSFAVEQEAPVVEDQYVTSVTATEATLEALINPKFTASTTYQIEYGTSPCSAGGCESVTPIEPGQLSGGAVNTGIATGPVALTGLERGTTYHFRFRAENEVTEEGESGPVFGAEGTFRTYAQPVPPGPCPNDPFRIGPATRLSDCRAYEMVSPVDKGGGEIRSLPNVPSFPAGINQGAPSGDALTYSSYRAFADPDSSPYASQYLAERNLTKGWENESISPPREGTIVPAIDTQYRAFSDDLSRGWFVTDSEPVLAEGGLPGYRNIYRRDNGTETYQAQCSAQPSETSAEEYLLEPQGASADGSHLVIWAKGRLLPEATPGAVPQIYECINGSQLRLVSVLPDGNASPTGGSAGIGNNGLAVAYGFHENNVTGAVSADGSRIFWTATETGPGALYVRINGTTTVQIAVNARFRLASVDGTRVIYSVGGELFEADVTEETASGSLIAKEMMGFMGASEDARFIYFASKEDLDGEGQAKAGDPNLYLYRAQADAYSFIGALSANDAREAFLYRESDPVLTPVARSPYNRSSRVTPDGLYAAFTSTAPLTGYDNTDQVSGEADAEVFLYDAEAEELLCVSCNPSRARPRGENVSNPALPFWAAAKIPGWENQTHASRALAEDGRRLFFEATDPLALGDTNREQDVYQWEAPGTGTCTERSSAFSPSNGGCVELISSGKSPQPSELIDASIDGTDVFFKTAQSLWPADPGVVDIYDARIEGGFPPPPPPKPECEGGACQAPPSPPATQTPGTFVFVGPGNVAKRPTRPKHCRKGTHKVKRGGKVRCVRNKSRAITRRAA